jgi:hypothetical protein
VIVTSFVSDPRLLATEAPRIIEEGDLTSKRSLFASAVSSRRRVISPYGDIAPVILLIVIILYAQISKATAAPFTGIDRTRDQG